MRPDLPWNVAGIPPEAREAARAAARREGLSVGEWLTRRILRSFSDTSEDLGTVRESWNGALALDEAPSSRRDTEEMLARVSRSETDSNSANRRIEEQLRTVARRLEATERSQSENNRAMSKAATEINIATREQAQAFDQLGSSVVGLSERLDRVERHSSTDAIKDAVKGLHQGLTRLADQVAQTATQSASQISALADNVESVAGKVSQVRHESEHLAHTLEDRLARLDDRLHLLEKTGDARPDHAMDDRLRTVERLAENFGSDMGRALSATAAIARLEESLARIEARSAEPQSDLRLIGIERTLAELAARAEAPQISRASDTLEERVKALAQRLDAAEVSRRAEVAELRRILPEKPSPASPPASPPMAPHPVFDAPPFADSGAFPSNAPSLQQRPEPFLPQPPLPEPPVPEAPPLFEPVPAYTNDQGPGAAPLAENPQSFLAAARRSAQAAAAQAESERSARGFGGFAWNVQSPAREQPRTRYGLFGLAALALILLIVAGALFSQRLESPAPRQNSLAPEFSHKPAIATLKPSVSQQPDLGPTSGDVAPEATTAAPPSALVPSATHARPAPSSPSVPALKPQTIATARVRRVPEARPPVASRPANAQAAPSASVPRQAAAMPALDRLTSLANAGNAKAETIVGLKYLDGEGVAANEGEASKWLERASEHGQPVAQYRLGTLYERGRGMQADAAKALHWYQASAQAGNRKAMHNLAVAYAQGSGTAKDYAEAARWFSRAAALGLADSQFNLAVLYERGLGVPQSLLDAYKWYAIAAAEGDAESKSRIDALSTQLSADDRAAAQRSADQFKPQALDAAANVPPQLSELGG